MLIIIMNAYHKFRDLSLDTLLIFHQSSVLSSNPEDWIRITVRRKHIFEDTLHKLWSGIDISKHLRITFIGEPAVDGGPMREYMRLLQYRFMVMFIFASCDTMLLSSIRRRTSMLVRYRLFHLFMVDQLLYFLLSQLPTTSCMDWRLKFPLQINKTRQSRGNYKKWVI